MAVEDLNVFMDPQERLAASVLIVEPNNTLRNHIRSCIKSLGYGFITDVMNHNQALERLSERRYTYVFFDAKKTNITPEQMLQEMLRQDPDTIAIPMSNEPRIDDVFNLFVKGARGFLVKPFTIDSIEEAIIWATKGEPIAESVLQAKDRNEALVAVVMSALDNVSTLLRQARRFETAERDVPRAMARLHRAAELAHTFCKGTDDDLLESIIEFSIKASQGPATKLGRMRKKLRSTREASI